MRKGKKEEAFKKWLKQAAAKALEEGRITRGDLTSYTRGAMKVFKKKSV